MTNEITTSVARDGVVRGDVFSGAEFSPCGRYRYRLWRVFTCRPVWGTCVLTHPHVGSHSQTRPAPVRLVAWCMLNPSVADHEKLDPTLRRCQGYARAWGYDGFVVTNLFAWRSTDPDELPRSYEAIGPGNEDAIEHVARDAAIVVCGWGASALDSVFRRGQVEHARRALGAKARHLGLTKHGHPRHPLYLPKGLVPQSWEEPATKGEST